MQRNGSENIPLGGMISTVVTPFRDDDTIDLDLLRAEVRYLLDAGVTAICACGSTGEDRPFHSTRVAQSARSSSTRWPARFR